MKTLAELQQIDKGIIEFKEVSEINKKGETIYTYNCVVGNAISGWYIATIIGDSVGYRGTKKSKGRFPYIKKPKL